MIVFRLGTMTVIEIQQDRVLIGPLGSRDIRVIGFDWSFGSRVSRPEQLYTGALTHESKEKFTAQKPIYIFIYKSSLDDRLEYFLCAKEHKKCTCALNVLEIKKYLHFYNFICLIPGTFKKWTTRR